MGAGPVGEARSIGSSLLSLWPVARPANPVHHGFGGGPDPSNFGEGARNEAKGNKLSPKRGPLPFGIPVATAPWRALTEPTSPAQVPR
jgi:hypothetical protein